MAARPGEFALIARLLRPLAEGFAGALGLADDAALISPGDGRELVVTQDALVAGVHFPADETPEAIAAKALRVNLSDLAAMGASPLAYLMTLALPDHADLAWLERFCATLHEEQARWRIALAGGDTVATPGPLTLSITALGTVAAGRFLSRAGARPGDRVFVSGSIGDAALGLAALRGELPDLAAADRQALVARLRLPEPRLALGRALVGVAGATIDVSDGLVADAGHLCEASAVAIVIDAAAVPLSPAARAVVAAAPGRLAGLLAGGDDYELVFTAADADAVAAAAGRAEVPVRCIGRVENGSGVTVIAPDGAELAIQRPGYRHF